jgi:hypothetical protein
VDGMEWSIDPLTPLQELRRDAISPLRGAPIRSVLTLSSVNPRGRLEQPDGARVRRAPLPQSPEQDAPGNRQRRQERRPDRWREGGSDAPRDASMVY